MEVAYVRNALDGSLMHQLPIQFLRLPVAGDFIFVPPNSWRVVHVFHFWNNTGPAFEIQVEPVNAHLPASNGHIAPF